mmetsp:Transcript_12948/g.24464  ORF Transcript_12948/g.24464 Transcript_12948/m.24464 type:complete len:208 (-) Transcript_12948:424-1047(-)
MEPLQGGRSRQHCRWCMAGADLHHDLLSISAGAVLDGLPPKRGQARWSRLANAVFKISWERGAAAIGQADVPCDVSATHLGSWLRALIEPAEPAISSIFAYDNAEVHRRQLVPRVTHDLSTFSDPGGAHSSRCTCLTTVSRPVRGGCAGSLRCPASHRGVDSGKWLAKGANLSAQRRYPVGNCHLRERSLWQRRHAFWNLGPGGRPP